MKKLFLIIIVCLLLTSSALAGGEKYIALTLDDGPSGRFTRRLLEGLEELDAKATFFLCGYRMEQYPELTKQIREEGHEIGLHGYTHDCMGTMTESCLARELDDTAEMAEALTGSPASLLRPPGGSFGEEVRSAARKRGLCIVTWSVDPRDWATDDKDAVVNHVLESAEDGDVILLHDMSDSSVDAALEIVRRMQANGFTFVTVSRLAQLKECKMVPGKSYSSFPSFTP